MTDRQAGSRRLLSAGPWILAALVVSGAGAGLFHLQARTGFVPFDHALDLSRPEGFVLPRSAPVGPSRVGYLRWEGRAPLRIRMPGLAAPNRLRLKLLPECPGAVVEVRVDGRPIRRLPLAPEWTLYTIEIEPGVAGEVLALAPAAGHPACAVHLSAVHTSALERRSSDYPRYWVVHVAPGTPPPPPDGPLPWVVAAVLLVTAAATAWRSLPGLASWLRLVAPGVVGLASVEIATRASGLRFVYPPASFPALLLAPGAILLAWRHRRALWSRARPRLRAATLALGARPIPVLAVLALLLWGWAVSEQARARFGGDPRGLIHFGTRFGIADTFPGVPAVSESGYDAQFYALLASDPLLADPATLERMDSPVHRATRVFVPFVAWLLALGRPELAVWTYLGLCWLLGLATVPLVAGWLREEGGSPWWAALLLVNAGLLVSVLRVTLDGPALCLLLLALAAWRRDRLALAAGAATAAALTREVFVLGGLAMAAVELGRRRWGRAAAYGLVPAACLALWRLRVMAASEVPGRSASLIFGLPLRWVRGQAAHLATLGQEAPGYFRAEVVTLVATGLTIVVAAWLVRRASRDPAALVVLAFAGLALFLSGDVYRDVYGYGRILVALPVLGLGLSGSPELPAATRRWLRIAAGAWAVAGLLVLAAVL
jgi:hypothetical protein